MEGTYEYELERAELLGVEPLNREEWEKQNQEQRRRVELEEEQNEIGQKIEADGEQIKGSHGKMDDLNSILSATQIKLNKFKTVCGSFTGLLRIRTASPAPAAESESAETSTVPHEPVPTTSSSDINTALDDLEKMKEIEGQSDLEIVKNQAIDIEEKATKSLSALDRLISKAESAQMAMESQRQQMKSYLKK